MASATEERIIKFVQELLLDEADRTAITPGLIGEKIDLIVTMNPKWRDGLDRQMVTDELIRRFSLWIGQDATLQNNEGHKDWLSSARKQDWRYWQRYREWLERKLSIKAVEALDRSTDSVLKLLEDPKREGPWDRRGLVVGHVQSGKTGHYSGLICKAADAEYKIIIVLAGLHNNLRSQTQMRLDEAFLGYKTSAFNEEAFVPIGVGEIDSDQGIRPNYATNRTEKGDFSTSIARNLGITPEQRPWLFVVKKNKSVLTRLLGWIRNHVANTRDQETGRRIVTHLPLLLIDDEADNASVDTKEMLLDENGRPDGEHEPTAINRLIRTILHSFSRSAYVGYTATPFANIFIHEQGRTREEGPDLFPEAFVMNLAAPSNYIGPAKVFGTGNENGRAAGLPLVRPVADFETWIPTKHRNGHQPLYEGQHRLPPSLAEAIDAFVLSCVAREVRGDGAEHCSMLIHVTRFTSVQAAVHGQVEERVRHLKQRLTRRIAHEPVLAALRTLWERDFVPTTASIAQEYSDSERNCAIRWEQIEAALAGVVSDIQVRMINGTAKDALDYAESRETGLKVIAIGGDKLARGLTLEGLTVSYFLRASRMYDTLMQMGRWFGYRPGYIDLCRLYTTHDLIQWFEHIADASEELREEFDFMAASGATPRDYGLKVQSHPVLMVTSQLKMRTARNLDLSFSGNLLETVTFHRDAGNLGRNLEAASKLLSTFGRPESNPIRHRNESEYVWEGSHLWEDVPAESVISFLGDYRSHPEAHKVNSVLLAEFIRSLVSEKELVRWTIALIGASRGEGAMHTFRDGVAVRMLQRTAHGQHPDRYSIGRLMSPRDEAIDLDETAWLAALAETRKAFHADPGRNAASTEPDVPSGPAIRRVRPRDRGVLFLYLIDPALAGEDAGLPEGLPPVLGFAVSFPASNSGTRVRYKVNNILWEQEYGSAE
ncbi:MULTISPECIES: Z1 domain-containing protein [unclassified Bradyrhizobium]|uniref:Z1 domain-containing protein n=1 Tax=unclassified Bradyrhizobium TaxID=2631580 RepID=UPI0029160677|nr:MULTISPECIES: Z1 domain-containing protein [unclassified Bradyrhizobium]